MKNAAQIIAAIEKYCGTLTTTWLFRLIAFAVAVEAVDFITQGLFDVPLYTFIGIIYNFVDAVGLAEALPGKRLFHILVAIVIGVVIIALTDKFIATAGRKVMQELRKEREALHEEREALQRAKIDQSS